MDGLDKNIAHLFPKELREAILKFFNTIYGLSYPKEWTYQILRPEVKKGHTIGKPKLRGIAISAMLPTLYDILIDNRFKTWYKINPEQAGFRERQGCLIQIFAIYLVMELAKSCNKDVFIGFIDYEKAFDFTNRFDIVKDLMTEKAGSMFTKAISHMYYNTFYVPKIKGDRTAEPISAKHGVTQGRKSSTSLFSFAIRDIPKSVKLPASFLRGFHVFQLADDASIVTTSFDDLRTAFGQIIDESDKKRMITNLEKTFYLNLSTEPITEPVYISNNRIVNPAENNEHLYLGMWFTTSNSITKQISCNISHRAFNVVKFYQWLEVNEMTPINIKIQVLDSCMFAAYLYGCECWWTIDDLNQTILATEQKLLKTILKVKPSTPTDIVYVELNRGDILSKIKERQKKFYEKCKKLKEEEAAVRNILELCWDLDICKYYESIPDNLIECSKREMKVRIAASTNTYSERYKEITSCKYNDNIYNQFLFEDKRIVISKWRLSSHSLRIETGRYSSPKLHRNERTCSICPTNIEDEFHVIFICPLYDSIRTKYQHLLLMYPTIMAILNPTNVKDAETLGNMLLQIEKIRKAKSLQ